jgi:site-specific recombinase XerD
VTQNSPSGLETKRTQIEHQIQSWIGQAQELLNYQKAANTQRAYESDWRHFTAWCEQTALTPLPADPATVVLYIAALSQTHKVATIERRIAAISQQHLAHNLESPTHRTPVRRALTGLRRQKGTAQQTKQALGPADLKRMLVAAPPSATGARDRALLIVGFTGAFRRAELAALDIADVRQTEEGLAIRIRQSKTDQERQGREVGLPAHRNPDLCPVAALNDWLRRAELTEGALFRPINRHGHILPQRLSAQAVAMIVQRYAEAIGLDAGQFGGHSLRAGLATAAARAGKSERAIMRQTGHKSAAMVRRYIREAGLFEDNAAAGLL